MLNFSVEFFTAGSYGFTLSSKIKPPTFGYERSDMHEISRPCLGTFEFFAIWRSSGRKKLFEQLIYSFLPFTYCLINEQDTCFIRFKATRLFVRLFMIILHVKIIAFQLSLFCKNFAFQKLYKQKNTWMLGNTRFISRVEHDISLVRCARS